MPDDPRDERNSDDPRDERNPGEKEAQDQEDDLTADWDAILGPRPEQVKDRLVREFGLTHPGRFTLATSSGRVLVEIDPDGKVRLGEGVAADEVAEEFWTMMALKRRGMEERLMHLGTMEALLIRVGRADLAYEQAQLRARSDAGTDADKYREELQRQNLESLVHQMIEFARGLAQQQPEQPPALPTRLH